MIATDSQQRRVGFKCGMWSVFDFGFGDCCESYIPNDRFIKTVCKANGGGK